MPSSILFVHQGYELYGSDRTLIQSVSAAAARWPGARITVLLPSDGPLMAALREIVDDVRVCELAVLRKSHLKHIRLRDIGSFVGKIAAARRMMQSYDVTYINTVMVMDYILAGSMVGRPHLVHVHEIPTGGAALFFSTLLGLSRSFLVFNSQATERGLKLGFWQRKAVLWNGVAGPGQLPARAAHDRLHLLLIGRFNAWKGQLLLLQAIARLPGHLRDRVRVRLVGGVFGGQSHFADRLASMIAEEKLTEVAEDPALCGRSVPALCMGGCGGGAVHQTGAVRAGCDRGDGLGMQCHCSEPWRACGNCCRWRDRQSGEAGFGGCVGIGNRALP